MNESTAGDGHVQTVLGPVPAESLGITLAHEHVFIDATCNWHLPKEPSRRSLAEGKVTMDRLGALRRNPAASRDNCLLTDLSTAVEEVADFHQLGGTTLIDVTNEDIGRDAEGLQRVSRATGVNIVAGCGHYVHYAHPPTLDDEPVESIADRLVAEISDGIGATGVKAGIIGEIGTSDPLHPREEKVLHAAAQAQRETGVAISLHVPNGNGHHVLDTLEAAGADLARVVVGHQDALLARPGMGADELQDYFRSLAERGCCLAFDTCGKEYCFPDLQGYGATFWFPSDRDRAIALRTLVDGGLTDKLLLSQDVCSKIDLLRYGGFGYGHILRSFSRDLLEVGVAREDVARILVDNPRRLLARS
ncbi:MAG TPA: hypothetical protein VFA44_12405 [Gaiellaceae bacterium]|nr:hypothetical protein [Gaiellaceae bacterium]